MIIDSKQKYEQLLEMLKKVPVIAMDTETDMFSKEKTHAFDLSLDGIGVWGDKVKAFIPVEFLDKQFQEVLDNAEKIIFHNFKFDGVILQKYGLNIDKIKYEDTFVMSWLLNENRPAHRLKYLAHSVLKVKEEKIVEFKDVSARPQRGEYGMFPEMFDDDYKEWFKNLAAYCIDDCKYTYKLYQKFYPLMEKQGLLKVYEKIERPLIRDVMNMEARGIKVDLRYLKEIQRKVDSDVIKLQATIWKEAGRQFDVNSPKQLSEILFGERKYELPDDFKTPKGANSTNASALEYLSGKHPEDKLLQNLFEYRELFKLSSTFIKGLIEKNREGIIYASFKQMGTKTGRFASTSPNMQQIPREAKYDVRKAFIAREGYTFIDIDLSQIELRLAAYFSQDPVMVQAFKEGKDIHQEMADILGCTRVKAKTASFGILYGTSAYGFAKNWDMSVEEATEFLRKYFAKFKKLSIFIIQCKNTLQRNYAVRSIAGRKRRFPHYAAARKDRDFGAVRRMERQAVNSVIQSSAADLIKYQTLKVAEALKGYDAHILLQIHDELVIEVPESKAEELFKLVKETMENAIKLKTVPIIAEGHISSFWKK